MPTIRGHVVEAKHLCTQFCFLCRVHPQPLTVSCRPETALLISATSFVFCCGSLTGDYYELHGVNWTERTGLWGSCLRGKAYSADVVGCHSYGDGVIHPSGTVTTMQYTAVLAFIMSFLDLFCNWYTVFKVPSQATLQLAVNVCLLHGEDTRTQLLVAGFSTPAVAWLARTPQASLVLRQLALH
jgi:hypothetical protein